MTDLAKATFTNHSVEVEVIEGDLGGEVDILGGGTTHVREARKGGLGIFDWETEGYKKDETGTTGPRCIMLDKATGETARRCKSHMARGRQ
jgi:hypothetical protein